MTTAPLVHRRARPRAAAALVICLLLAALMTLLSDDLNPDWLGYAAIYADAGAWLKDQGRDPLFVGIISAASALAGPSGYLAFRIAVGCYFAFFTYLLLTGRLLELSPRAAWPSLLIGLLPLAAPRFTIQIREGIALTLAVFAVAALGSLRTKRSVVVARPQWGIAFGLLAAACAVHSGVLILLVAGGMALVVHKLGRRSIGMELRWLRIMSVVTVITAGLAAAVWPSTREGTAAIDAVYSWLIDDDTAVTAAKWLYWLAYGVGISIVTSSTFALYRSDTLLGGPRSFVGVMGIVLLPAVYGVALVLLAVGTPRIVISAVARLMNMLMSLLFIVFAARGAMTSRLAALSALVLLDQARVIFEAIFGNPGELT